MLLVVHLIALKQPTESGKVLLCRVPGITPDDLDELKDIMEVTVEARGDMGEPEVRKHVRGCAEQFAERLSKLQGLLKQR